MAAPGTPGSEAAALDSGAHVFAMRDAMQQQMQGILQPIVDRLRKLEAGTGGLERARRATDEGLARHAEAAGQLNAGLLALGGELKTTNSTVKAVSEALDRTTRQKDQLAHSLEASQAHLGRVEATLLDSVASVSELQRRAADRDQEMTDVKAALDAANSALAGGVANSLKSLRQGLDDLSRRQERANQTAAELRGLVDRNGAKLSNTAGHAECNETRIKEMEADLQAAREQLAATGKCVEELCHKAASQGQVQKSVDADLRLARRTLDKMGETNGHMSGELGHAVASLNELIARVARDENRMSQSDARVAKLERMLAENTNTDEESSNLLSHVHQETRRLAAQLSKAEHSVADLEMKHGRMSESVEKQGDTVNDLVKNHRRVAGTTQTLTADLDATNQAMAGVRQGLDSTRTAVANLKTELGCTSDGVASLTRGLSKCEANFAGMHQGLQGTNSSVRASLTAGVAGPHGDPKPSAQALLPGLVESPVKGGAGGA